MSGEMEGPVKIVIIVAAVLGTLLALTWLGLRIKPKPFPAWSQEPSVPESVPVPTDLPKPVARFYEQVYGDRVPLVSSAVVSGQVTLRLRGITFPGRFRFTYVAGKAYRHEIDVTLYGVPIMRVDERYADGASRLNLPFGVIEEGPNIDQGANLGLWAESIWFPALLVTDPAVMWEPIDDDTAALIVPYGGEKQRFIARFDPETGLLRMLESMRYQGSDSSEKTLWLNEAREWDTVDGYFLPVVGALTWFGEPAPWAVFHVTDIVYNTDVSAAFAAPTP